MPAPRTCAGLVLLLIGSCVAGEGRTQSRVEFLYSKSSGFQRIVNRASAIAEVQILSIADPHWNSRSEEYWDGDSERGIGQGRYSQVVVRVQDVIASDEGLPDEFVLLVFGDASERYEGPGVPEGDGISGGFSVGASHLLLLKQHAFKYEHKVRRAWTLAAHFEGTWRVSGSQAFGSDISRSLPESELRNTLLQAWANRGSRSSANPSAEPTAPA